MMPGKEGLGTLEVSSQTSIFLSELKSELTRTYQSSSGIMPAEIAIVWSERVVKNLRDSFLKPKNFGDFHKYCDAKEKVKGNERVWYLTGEGIKLLLSAKKVQDLWDKVEKKPMVDRNSLPKIQEAVRIILLKLKFNEKK